MVWRRQRLTKIARPPANGVSSPEQPVLQSFQSCMADIEDSKNLRLGYLLRKGILGGPAPARLVAINLPGPTFKASKIRKPKIVENHLFT